MKNNRTIIIFLAIVLVFVTIIAFQDKKPVASKISIGAVIPQTGFGSYWGKPVLMGIDLAREDLAMAYGAENVSILVEDGQSSVPASVNAAQKLLSIDKVDAIYSEFSGMSSAISPLAKAEGKVLMYSTFNQKIAEDNETSIKTFISYETACEAFAKRISDPAAKILIISAISDAAPYCQLALSRHYKTENIKVVEGFAGNDFRTLLLQNKSFDPGYIIPIMYEDGSFALIKQKNEMGLKAKLFCYRQDCVTEKNLTALPKAYTEGTLFFEVLIDQKFADMVRAKYPNISNDDLQAVANSYQSIMALGEGLAACTDKTAACVVKNIGNKSSLDHAAYKNAKFVNRVLVSELAIGFVSGGVASTK